MSAAGWQVSDSPNPTPDSGWTVSDQATPPAPPSGPQQTIEPPEARTVGNYAREALGGIGTGLKNTVVGAFQAVRHPMDTAVGIEKQVFDQAIPAAQQEFKETEGADLPSRIVAAGLSGAEKLPIVGGPITKAAGAGIASPESVGAASELATYIAAPKIAEKTIIAPVSKFVQGRTPVPAENFTPRQAASHAAVVAEGSSAGDTGYIPKDIANATSSKLRSTAAANPNEVNAIRKGSPEEAYAAHQSILEKAKSDIDQAHEAALKPVENTPVDMSGVQEAITPSKAQLEGMDPADVEAINALKDRAGNVTTLRGLNEFRKTLNTEDTTLRNALAPGKSALYPQTVHQLANAARNAYYDSLEKATGQSFREAKALEGNIIQEMRGAQSSGSRLSVSQAKADAPTGARETAADLLDTGGKLPIVGKVASALRGTKLGQIQQHLQRFYSGLPDAPAVTPKAAPVPAFNQPQLPASTPANAQVGPAGAPSTPTVAPPAASPTPSVITPEPDAVPQLPAQAGPDATGAATVQPSNPPPPLNTGTASTRTRPPLPANPQPTPAGRTTVTPEGVATPERKLLPAPSPKTNQTLKIGDEVTVKGRTGEVAGMNPKTGKVIVKWR